MTVRRILAAIVCAVGIMSTAWAADDKAYIVIQKDPERRDTHIVRIGDTISSILMRHTGHPRRNLKELMELNPHVRDVNLIHPGQQIFLQKMQARIDRRAEKGFFYTVRKGDTLSSIIWREMKLTGANLRRALRLTQSINPDLNDVNLIRPGQRLLLPSLAAFASPEAGARIGETKEEIKKMAIGPPRESILRVLETILARMNARLITQGTYHIPLPQAGSISIDNSIVNLVEFADGSLALLDFNRRLPPQIEKLLTENWPGITLAQPQDTQSIPQILGALFASRESYFFRRLDAPILVGSPAEVEVWADWLISWPQGNKLPAGRQVLIFVEEPRHLLPRNIQLFLEENGLIVTEILDDVVIPKDIATTGNLRPVSSLPGKSNRELVFNLLELMGLKPRENVKVDLVRSQDGFRVLFNADLLLPSGGRQVIFHLNPLTPPFVSLLAERGYHTVDIDTKLAATEALRRTIEAVPLPVTSGSFSFSIPGRPEGGVNRIIFPGLKIPRDKGHFYLIAFDLDPHLYDYLRSHWKLEILRH